MLFSFSNIYPPMKLDVSVSPLVKYNYLLSNYEKGQKPILVSALQNSFNPVPTFNHALFVKVLLRVCLRRGPLPPLSDKDA